ncbi:hypothetical protein EJH11_01315 [Salmonella enterica subsp. enterica]|uniref:Uncharacterized protein n=1 Tax=Salmonella gallinarum TaxID=594 RepID=A0A737F410_SALGL|nr:hypothetical protein CJD41_09990 [Salmonella enterica subsp. enterica serovar Pullorum]EBH8507452.1 hypothetical protein [Salmonella enterica subsp. enterica serovar Gallinarum]ECD0074879.1 hypothetical protein [Salmonella enterica subsp. enterica]EAB7576509.1 hypothetical protein [Salmonella enterica subsp. enterica serovar Pullorum]EBH8978754.1 hypothetical protein [Salmonella enterica subsp. enterica serovar Gallinarum]
MFSKNSFMNAPKTSYANSLLLFPSRQHRDYVKKQRADIENIGNNVKRFVRVFICHLNLQKWLYCYQYKDNFSCPDKSFLKLFVLTGFIHLLNGCVLVWSCHLDALRSHILFYHRQQGKLASGIDF